MRHTYFRALRVPGIASLLLAAQLGFTACGGGEGSFVGKWESNIGGMVVLDLQPGGKLQISTLGIASEGTWEVAGKNQIVVHGPRQDMTLSLNEEGELTDGLMSVFTKAKN